MQQSPPHQQRSYSQKISLWETCDVDTQKKNEAFDAL